LFQENQAQQLTCCRHCLLGLAIGILRTNFIVEQF